MKYRKKPVVIEAIQWNGNNLYETLCFMNCSDGVEPETISHNYKNEITIKTLEGDMKVSVGDYIIKGIKGEFYPCKPDIFEASYEKVKES